MTYIEIKRIKGRLYKYARKSYRVNGKVRHTSKYLGPVEPVAKRKKGQGRKPSIFVRTLRPGEIAELNRAKRSSESFRKDRARILLLSSQRKSIKEICSSLSKDRKSVTSAIKAFNAQGTKALIRKKAKGAKPKFTKEQRTRVLEAVMTEPRKLNLPFTTWSLPKLKAYLIESRAVDSISIETIRKILHSQGVKLTKSKRWQYSNDPDFFKKTPH
jgi:transposase